MTLCLRRLNVGWGFYYLGQKEFCWDMVKKITVIGGSGFIGTNFCHALKLKKQDFEIIDLKISKQFPKETKIGDVRILDSLRSTITGDIVVNLAAVHRDDIRDKAEYQKTNIEGAKNTILVCKEQAINKIIFTSTVAVYGFAEPGTDESGEIKPFNEYGRSKFEAEEIFRGWQKGQNSSLIIVRPTVIFGEGNRGNVFNLFNQIASGKFFMLGKGENKKSIAYIGNLVAFLEACLVSKKQYGLFNYVDTPDLTMNDLVAQVRLQLRNKRGVGLRLPLWLGVLLGCTADALSAITRRNFPVSRIRVKKFTSSTQFSSAKFELKGFSPPFKLTEGIERTLQSEFINPDPQEKFFYRMKLEH